MTDPPGYPEAVASGDFPDLNAGGTRSARPPTYDAAMMTNFSTSAEQTAVGTVDVESSVAMAGNIIEVQGPESYIEVIHSPEDSRLNDDDVAMLDLTDYIVPSLNQPSLNQSATASHSDEVGSIALSMGVVGLPQAQWSKVFGGSHPEADSQGQTLPGSRGCLDDILLMNFTHSDESPGGSYFEPSTARISSELVDKNEVEVSQPSDVCSLESLGSGSDRDSLEALHAEHLQSGREERERGGGGDEELFSDDSASNDTDLLIN